VIAYLFVTFDNHEEEFRDVKEKKFEERHCPMAGSCRCLTGILYYLSSLYLNADLRVPAEPHMRARHSGLIEDIILYYFYYI